MKTWNAFVGAAASTGSALLLSMLIACPSSPPGGETTDYGTSDEPPVTASVGDRPGAAAGQEARGEADAGEVAPAVPPVEGLVEEEIVEEEPVGEQTPTFLAEENQREVTLYFQDPDSDYLVPEKRKIFLTASIVDQAKQVIVELINGPRDSGLLPTFPPSTQVLGLYLDRWGTAYVDLSSDLVTQHIGGTTEELATIFSLVNSLTINLPKIKRVHILIDGEERETLKSHLDLQRDFAQDLSIIRENGG